MILIIEIWNCYIFVVLFFLKYSVAKVAVVTLATESGTYSSNKFGESVCLVPLLYHSYKTTARVEFDFVVLTVNIPQEVSSYWYNSHSYYHCDYTYLPDFLKAERRDDNRTDKQYKLFFSKEAIELLPKSDHVESRSIDADSVRESDFYGLRYFL